MFVHKNKEYYAENAGHHYMKFGQPGAQDICTLP